ncbi:MAG: apolipoprotein N-acyltransferase [Elusimicrobia bacterium]|nr:apolipoprotein N-acyltransferase [Candidatus Obscuribacterium magneticum]
MVTLPLFSSALSGILFALAFPSFNLSWLAWVALVPLLRLTVTHPKNAFACGLVTGLLANLIIFQWLLPTFKAANINVVTGLLCWVLLSAVLALYVVLFFSFYIQIPFSWLRPWLAGAMWVVLEDIRTHLLSGFPWALLGHTQAYHLVFIQLASLTGVSGLSFLLIAANSFIAEFLRIAPARHYHLIAWRRFLFSQGGFIGLLLITYSYGWFRLNHPSGAPERTLKVSILQGNIDQYQKWDDHYETGIRTRYTGLAEKAAADKPELIVWPESAVPGWIPNEKFYLDWLQTVVKKTGTANLVGAVSMSSGADYNSAFLLSPKGEILQRYDKRHLVPFGEFNPLGGFFNRLIPYLGQLGTFAAGKRGVIFDLNGIRLAPNICYEAIFADLIRSGVNQGADVIVNLTNDGWYLQTAAPEQHFVANIFRAVENGRPVIRAANTGISGLIDPFGRPLLRTPLMETGAFTGEVPMASSSFQTFYLRFGNWFTYFCWALIAFFISLNFRRSSRWI